MRRIAIVGAGQAGLQLGLGLLAHGYHVTLTTDRSADQVRNGKVMSSQCMFDTALQTERNLGLNLWEDICPTVEGIGFTVPDPLRPETPALDWSARLNGYAQAVDQRLKMPAWMDAFERYGGQLVIEDVDLPTLEHLTRNHDLTLLAAGKGEVVNLLHKDIERTAFQQPQRALALTYVRGVTPVSSYSRVAFNLIPGVGEYFVFPALTLDGPCQIMVFEGIPGGPMDCWQEIASPEQHLERSLDIVRRFTPWEAERYRNVELTDPGGVLVGRFTPTVRQPLLRLPSGRLVLGMADAAVLNDPITGQGANNAAKCSKVYLDAILARGGATFTPNWMHETFELYWNYARHVVSWTNSLLTPAPPHILELLSAAERQPAIASHIVSAFDDPRHVAPWWFDAALCQGFIQEHSSRVV